MTVTSTETYKQALNRFSALVDRSKVTDQSTFTILAANGNGTVFFFCSLAYTTGNLYYTLVEVSTSAIANWTITIESGGTNSTFWRWNTTGNKDVFTDMSNQIVGNTGNVVFRVYY